ncbi:MAG: dinitrogenase iron-molybdenum cofactor biosynthesis protein [candidate division Zixibacteria bacterium]|nr:dinitrogenase iron-molybdenum cofactor biosynthesis protein [candidate division Zixibacteria bacterium]
MKVAVVTDDGVMISEHFGQALEYAVYTVEVGRVVSREMRTKAGQREFVTESGGDTRREHEFGRGRGSGFGEGAGRRHGRMIAVISDCDVVLAGGMGAGMRRNLAELGIKPILTDIKDIDTAITQFLNNTLTDHPELAS